MQQRVVFPFSGVVSLDKLKLALLINAINPKIGGVLIRGPKGSGKTTLARALADILPRIPVVKDCPFQCDPFDSSNMCPKCRDRYREGKELPTELRDMTVVNLPLGATEDRVIGSLDVEKAIKHGIEALEPGILAEANQNILYVDEINLLPDHIADDLLDAAATGWNVVEREGISVSHPSRFIFIGTMNPEEGELRPQLLDRFPLSVSVERISSVRDRMEVVRRNIEYEKHPEKFIEEFQQAQEELKNRIVRARKTLLDANMPGELLKGICKACLDLKVDGMRPDIVISKAATTLAAFENRAKVTVDDVMVAAELALSHRTREGGFLEPATSDVIKKSLLNGLKEMKYQVESEEKTGKDEKHRTRGRSIFKVKRHASRREEDFLKKHKKATRFRSWISQLALALDRLFNLPILGSARKLRERIAGAPTVKGLMKASTQKVDVAPAEQKPKTIPKDTTLKAGATFKGKDIGLRKIQGVPSVSSVSKRPETSRGLSLFANILGAKTEASQTSKLPFKIKAHGSLSTYAGKRAEVITSLHRGRPQGWKFPSGKPKDVHLPSTIRAASRKRRNRINPFKTALPILMEDVREKRRTYKAPMTIVFVIDVSGSMLMSIDAIKEAILKLHGDAYRYRDRVGIVALKDNGAIVVQHPITNLRVVANKLLKLRISGFTPLAAGMLKAWEVLKEAKRRDKATIPVMAIITDGSANVPLRRSLETGEMREFSESRIAVRDYEDIAVRDVMAVSKMIAKQGINTIVVNTNPHHYGRESYGNLVTEYISSVTGGSLHGVGKVRCESELVEKIMGNIAEDQRLIAHTATSHSNVYRFND